MFDPKVNKDEVVVVNIIPDPDPKNTENTPNGPQEGDDPK